jgi:hypothetical protein
MYYQEIGVSIVASAVGDREVEVGGMRLVVVGAALVRRLFESEAQ